MFLGKKKKFVLLIVTFFFVFSQVVFAADIPANEELLREIRELKKLVKAQGERIEYLETQYSQRQVVVKEDVVEIEEVEVVESKHLSKDLRRRLARLGTAAGLDIGAGATFIGQGTPNANNAMSTDGAESRFDGSYKYDFDISKTFGDFGKAYI